MRWGEGSELCWREGILDGRAGAFAEDVQSNAREFGAGLVVGNGVDVVAARDEDAEPGAGVRAIEVAQDGDA